MNKHLKKLDEQIAIASANVDENVLVSHLFDSVTMDNKSSKRSGGGGGDCNTVNRKEIRYIIWES